MRERSTRSGIIRIDFDGGHVAGSIEIGLRFGERHEHEGGVVFRHADLEHCGDLVCFNARRGPHRGDRAARGNKSDAVARPQRQLVGKPASDCNPLPLVEALKRALPDVVGDRRQLQQIGGANPAREDACGAERRGCKRLAFDNGRGELDAVHLGNPVGNILPVGQRRFQRLDQEVAVKAQDLFEQLLPEPVHHRHDDDEGGNAEHDAEKTRTPH